MIFRLSKAAARTPLAILVVSLAASSYAARHENWVEVRSPNFVVVSDASEKQARKTALQFEQIREVFRQSLPIAGEHPSPIITVLEAKDEDTMRELLPEDWTKGHVHHAGMFVYRMNIYFAAVELSQEGPNANGFETFYHEYYHSLTIPYFPNLPLWVAEGLAEFYGHTQIDDKSVGMGQPDAQILAELKRQPLIPVPLLFKVDQNSPYYNEEQKTSIFYAESWALTHYLMVGDRQAHRQQFVAYLRALAQGKSQDEAAAAAFGDVRKLESDLLSYIHNASFYYMKVPAVAKVRVNELKVRGLSEAEATAYRGGFAAIRGRPDDAKRILEEAMGIDPKVALVHEYLGLSQYFEGNHDSALQSISKAIDLDPNNGFTRFLRAELVVQSGGLMEHNPQVEADLRQAIALSPNLPPPYGLLAVYMASHNENLDEALKFAQKAVAFEPGNANYQLALAQVLVRMNKYDEAKAAAAKARAWARDPEEKANAETFMNFLERAQQFHDVPSAGEAVEAGSANDASARVVDTVEGLVASESCQGGLKLELQSEDGILQLREPARGDVAVSIDGGAIPHFTLCNSLTGLRVEIHYSPDDPDAEKPSSGIIRSMRVIVPAAAAELPAGTAIAEGKITSVTCNGNEMRMTLAARDKSLIFHAADFHKITYLAGTNSVMGDLDPCSELKLRSAKITYAESRDKQLAGEIQVVVVGK